MLGLLACELKANTHTHSARSQSKGAEWVKQVTCKYKITDQLEAHTGARPNLEAFMKFVCVESKSAQNVC